MSKRQTELESNYKDALRALDAEEWQEAIRLLRRVRGLQAGYRESDTLLRRAESELDRSRKEKSKPKSTEGVEIKNNEWLVLAMFAAFALSRAIPELLLGGPIFAWIEENSSTYAALAIYFPVFGILMGFALRWMMRNTAIQLNRSQTLSIILTPSITIPAFLLVAYYYWAEQGVGDWIWPTMFSLIGLSIGFIFTVIFREVIPPFSRRQSLITILGWGVAFYIGQRTAGNISYGLGQVIENTRIINLIDYSLEAGIAGLIGSMFILGQLKKGQNTFVDRKTVWAAILGFGLGNLLINILFGLYEDLIITLVQLLIWGFLGGAALAFPSKIYKNYLILGLSGSIGMAFGYLVWKWLGEPEGLYPTIFGVTLGLCLGFGTKKTPGALILLMIGTIAYNIRNILNSIYYDNYNTGLVWVEYSILALSAAIMGLIIGLTWSLFKSSEANPLSKNQAQ
jgi:hypothetical protein